MIPWPLGAEPQQKRHLRAARAARLLGAAGSGLIALLLFSGSLPALAESDMPPAYWADRQLPDARAEARAEALMDEIRCLVCQGQSIADSDAELAGDMRDLVRRRIAAGETPADVRTWLIARYGGWISYKPNVGGAALPLWLLPLVLLIVGGVVVARRVRKPRS